MTTVKNLYIHFPFCRRKCTYCALPSTVGNSVETKDEYVKRVVNTLEKLDGVENLRTIYFGGGSPALCNLKPILDFLQSRASNLEEFTVELHPLNVTRELLETLKSGGVNRISMGLQSLDDATLKHMGRAYTFDEAEKIFLLIKEYFENSGIDLIVGYPILTRGMENDKALSPSWMRLANWDLAHASVYSLIWEEDSILSKLYNRSGSSVATNWEGRLPSGDRIALPSDDQVLNKIAVISRFLRDIGLERYEISNYAKKGKECKHNLAVWNGEDYYGIGDGAHGRLGLLRTENWWGGQPFEQISPAKDSLERTIFRLRTRDGIDATKYPQWLPILDNFVKEGLLIKLESSIYRLTERGTEVCDSILSELF